MALQTDRQKTAHLLRRFGLGASVAELDFYGQGGYAAAVDRLVDYDATAEGYDVDLQSLANAQGNVNIRAVQAHWYLRLAVTRRPLQEKLTLFWHDHFAVSAQKVDVPPAMHQYVDVLRRHALDEFPKLTLEVSKSPAMLYWLDNQLNVSGKPNENFAREVMELFTLGIGHYSEKDVQEAARAFTGWGYGIGPVRRPTDRPVRNAEFVFRQAQHDTGAKTVLGSTGAFNGADLVNLTAYHPQTARHIVTKMWEWFAYPKPDEALVGRLAKGWRENDLSIRWLVKAIALSPEFVSARAERAIYKNPVDFTISTYRQLGIGQNALDAIARSEAGQAVRALAPMAPLVQTCKSMGMELLYPPDVAGWDGGASWISTATMVERIKWADRIFGAPQRNSPALRYPVATLFGDDTAPDSVVDKLVAVFDAQVAGAKRAQLVAAAREAQKTGAPAMAAAVCRLLFATPEFQMA